MSVTVQCHGLWDNKEVEMPDFFKKLKKKVDKKKMTGGDKMGGRGKPTRRLKFLPLQASTTSMFCRRKRGDSAGSQHGEYSEKTRFLFKFDCMVLRHSTLTICDLHFSISRLIFFPLER